MKNEESSDPIDLTELESRVLDLEDLLKKFAPHMESMNTVVKRAFDQIRMELAELREEISALSIQPVFVEE